METRRMRFSRGVRVFSLIAILALIGAMSGFIFSAGSLELAGGPRLVSYEPLPEMDGEMCQWVPASAAMSAAAFRLPAQGAGEAAGGPQARPSDAEVDEVAKRSPVRVIRDPNSAYSGIAVDPVRNEVVMTDENLFSILVYDRRDNTPPSARMTEPKRVIQGESTEIEFQCSLYVDPATGDIYAVNNDTLDKLVVFPRDVQGDVAPVRELETPHTTFGIAVDEEKQEMFLTIQDDHAVVVYDKAAAGDADPTRLLQGNRTLLADPHGIAVDSRNGLLFVSNWGSSNQRTRPPADVQWRGAGRETWPVHRNFSVPGSGQFSPPSITIYPIDAKGDTPPLRVIQGPKTQLDWPTALSVDPQRRELYIANDTGNSVLVFSTEQGGDAEPLRVLKGPKTLINNPTGIFFDGKNDELWVANFGNHSATVYRRDAAGDTPPLRVIRSAPLEDPAPMLGNPHTVTYDTKREEILVAN